MKRGTARATPEERETKAHVDQLTALHKTLLDITSQRDLTKQLEAIIRRATRLLEGKAGGLYLCDAEKQACTCAVSYRTQRDYTGTVLKYGEGAIGKVAASRQPLLIDDYRSREAHPENTFDVDQPFQALLVVPMLWHGQVRGVIDVLREQPFTQADLELLTMFASPAAIAVENARALEAEYTARVQAEKEITERKFAEQALRASEGRLAHLIETVPSGITFVERSGKITYANRAAEKILSLTRGGITDRVYNDLDWKTTAVDGGAFPDEQLPFRRVMQTNEPVHGIEHAIEHPDGTRVILSINAAPLWDAHGDLIGMVAALSDITERKRAEEARQEGERRFREMLENVELIAVTLDAVGRITFCNEYLLRLTGRSRADVLGQDWFAMFVPTELHVDEVFKSGIEQGTIVSHFENEILTISGERRLVSWNNTILRDTEGRVIGTTSIGEDITERKRAEKALRHSQEETAHANRLLLALSHASQAVQRAHTTEEVYAAIQEQVTQMGYYTAGFELAEDDHNLRIAYYNYRPDLLRKAERTTGIPLRDFRFRLRADSIYHRIIVKGETVFVQDTVQAVADALPKKLRTLARPMASLFKLDQSIFAPLQVGEEIIGILAITGSDLTEADTPAITAFANQAAIAMQNARLYEQAQQEIAERTRAEQTQVRLVAMLDATPGFVGFADATDTHILYINPAGRKMVGVQAQEDVTQLKIADVHPEWTNKLLRDESIPTAIRDGIWIGECAFLNRDGREISVMMVLLAHKSPSGEVERFSTISIDITERKLAEEKIRDTQILLRASIESPKDMIILSIDKNYRYLYFNTTHWKTMLHAYGKNVKLGMNLLECISIEEDRVKAKINYDCALAGESHVTIQEYGDLERSCYETRYNPIFNDKNEIIGATAFSANITERKRAEEELTRSHEQLRALTLYWQNAIEAERAMIARELHDEFGQSMTALKMDLTWLTKRLPEGDEKIERLHGMDMVVDDSIALMRRIATELRPNLLDDLGLNAALEWQAQEFTRRSGISCKLNLPKEDLDLDSALSTSLFRIFQEALTNITRHAQATRVNTSLKKNEQTLVLTIRDNGRGILESELEDPRSLGLLGLRERAAQWGGKTSLRGAAGKGTTVTVRIPLRALTVNGGKL